MFENVKKYLSKPQTLAFYDPSLYTIVYTDASPSGAGAVLVQKKRDGIEKVVQFAAKTLTTAERRYPQTQREALGAVWGFEKFYFYLFGKKFTLRSDYKALKFIFTNEIPQKKSSFASRIMGIEIAGI